MYVMDQQKHLEKFFPLMEFAYNSYGSTIKMVPFEFIYGWLCWMLEDRVLVGPEEIQEMEDQMKTIIKMIKEAEDRQKNYVDARRVDHSYDVAIEYLEAKPT